MAEPKRLALMDADIPAYKISSGGQNDFDWGTGVVSYTDDLSVVTGKIDNYLEGLVVRHKLDRMIICLSCPSADNFRLDILPSYKGNRVDAAKPLLLAALRLHLTSAYEFLMWNRLEADDVLGIVNTSPVLFKGYKKLNISADKDLRTVPSWLLNPDKDTKPKRIELWDSQQWHLMQTLMGDTTDGYKGCPKVGPKTAAEVLDGATSHADSWRRVVEAYVKRGLTEDDALVQARCAFILQHQYYNTDTEEITLWLPPK